MLTPRISGNAVVLVLSALLVLSPLSEAKRALGGGNRKSGGGHTTRRQPDTHVTKPTYSISSGNSHADQAKLSYPNYNAQPNRPASAPSSSNSQPIGWNVPNNQHPAGPPPAYSPSNVAGGAKTNVHEPPPVYQKPNYAAPPPNYNQATGTHYGSASYPQQQLPAGATYHSPNNLPPGATYYNNPSHVPGGYPMAGGYPMGGGYHAPGGGGGYYPPNSVPAGASYFPAGGQLPPGAVLYSSPPQQTSSGLGFGSGLAAGAIGGAILGHVLTPTQTKVVEQAPAAGNAAGGGDRVIIINNTGQPINATDANGATVINAGGAAAPAAATGDAAAAAAPMAPLAPLAPMAAADEMNNTTLAPPMAGAGDANATTAEQPPAPAPGGIICVPVRVNATDPNDASKMMEVEQIACYPAPPPAAAPAAMDPATAAGQQPPPAEGSAPLAPIQPIPGEGSQQLQQSTLVGEQNAKQADSAANPQQQQGLLGLIVCFVVSYALAY
ncbi:nascent polypeptide-associated complex subunit alpha, muscle-specific form-like [Musca vetustissima]|uniref:nascent polypeptide-associated complex subunit alpha, muscle-specific form-like n=1 Tax=Musca vetustissima TaxID=27455 RepID=UPI002AB6BD19|nr:nascent polypeptide-associated complex subunit alpha, muscle-specific form-like [Musca vetustissima]